MGAVSDANSELEQYADKFGDNSLVEILNELPPHDLIALMRDHDVGKTSVVTVAISPESFVSAIKLEYLYGEDRWDYVFRLRNLMNGIMYRDDQTIDEVLNLLSKDSDGIRILSDYFSEYYEELLGFVREDSFKMPVEWPVNADELKELLDSQVAAAREFESFACGETVGTRITREEASDGDWMETAWVLAHEYPVMFASLLESMTHSAISRRRKRLQRSSTMRIADGSRNLEGRPGQESEDDDESAI